MFLGVHPQEKLDRTSVQNPLDHGCSGLSQVPLSLFPWSKLQQDCYKWNTHGVLGCPLLHHSPTQGWTTFLHYCLDRVWMGICEACALQQREEGVHGGVTLASDLQLKDVLKFGFSSREYVLLHDQSKEEE